MRHRTKKNDVGRLVTATQRHQLLQIYLHMGNAVARGDCIEAGVSPRYAMQIAREMGIAHRVVFGGGRKTGRVRLSDPRWEWAKARGVVIA